MHIASIHSSHNPKTNESHRNPINKERWNSLLKQATEDLNPLQSVNSKRNELIKKSINKEDWSDYNQFQAKQHPAWYEETEGAATKNKTYYGNLLESHIRALKEAKLHNDDEAITTWSERIEEGVKDFNDAPGVTPYVVGLNNTESLAAKFGVAQANDSWFDSKWNDPIVDDQGNFNRKNWYENAYMEENPIVAQATVKAAQIKGSPEVAKAAAEMETRMDKHFASQYAPTADEGSQSDHQNVVFNKDSLSYVDMNQLITNKLTSNLGISADAVKELYSKS